MCTGTSGTGAVLGALLVRVRLRVSLSRPCGGKTLPHPPKRERFLLHINMYSIRLVCMYMHTHVYIYIYICVHTHGYIYIYIYVFVCIYIYICIIYKQRIYKRALGFGHERLRSPGALKAGAVGVAPQPHDRAAATSLLYCV